MFDLALACAGLAIFLLPMAWIAWVIFKQEGRPVLFSQVRVGRFGRSFFIWKFRTMTADGRVTEFGKKLRETAMDELPQLFNILKGEMGFVGPRPLIPEELSQLDQIPEGKRRLGMRPGLTGLAQLNTPKVPALAERVRWDLIYADRCSMRLDLQIIARSVGITFRSGWERPR